MLLVLAAELCNRIKVGKSTHKIDVCVVGDGGDNLPAYKVPDYICMTNQNCVRIIHIVHIGTMEMLSESSFDPGCVLEDCLGNK